MISLLSYCKKTTSYPLLPPQYANLFYRELVSTIHSLFTFSLGLFSEYNVIAAATLTCEFLSFNSFEIASISSGSSTVSNGGVGPFDLSNIIPVSR